jgi:hypothetical protein
MCTLTIIPTHSRPGARGFRLVTNRDESRKRPAGLPPSVRRVGAARAVWPVDPAGGGTWVGVNDRGVVASLLNVNAGGEQPPPPDGGASRGEIIPSLIDVSRAGDAIKRLGRIDLACFRPFRLVVVDVWAIFEAAWDRRSLRIERRVLGPACFVSSGLGDALAAPRLELWRRWPVEGPPGSALQDAFHKHQWPDRPEISVRMNRADARTVSTTVVEVGGVGAPRPWDISMRYDDGAITVVRLLEDPSTSDAELACSGEPGRC